MAQKSAKAAKTFIVNESYDKLLAALGWLHYARSDQLTRLYHSPRSETLVRSRLRELVTHKYVSYLSLISDGKNTKRIYALAGRGMNYLKDTGRVPEDRYFRPSDIDRSPFFLPHTLDVGDFLIACEILVRNDPRFQIITRKHDLDLRREKRAEAQKTKIIKAVEDKVVEKKMYVYPDGFVLLSMSQGQDAPRKFGIWLEVDRNTKMDNTEFKDRIRGIYTYYASGEYEKKYGTKSLRVAYIITEGGHHRMRNLCELAQKELASTNEKAKVARIFRFAVAPPSWDYLDAEKRTGKPLDVVRNLFFNPVWHVPFEGHEQMPLLRIT